MSSVVIKFFVTLRYHTPDTNLFVPAIVMYMVGVVFFQFLIEGVFLAWFVYQNELDATNIMLRHGDLFLLTDVLGLDQDFKVALREVGISTCRFCCEDISQTIIQILFLFEDHESSENNDLVMVSIAIAISLSATKFVGALWKWCKSDDQR